MKRQWVSISMLRKAFMKHKRVSHAVKFCSKHGRFAGYAWCGHRRLCKAKEVTEAQWYAQLKPKPKKIEPWPVDAMERVLKAVKPKGTSPLEKAAKTITKPKETPTVSATLRLVQGLKDTIFDLDSEIAKLTSLVKETSEKLLLLKGEREKIREAVKSLQK